MSIWFILLIVLIIIFLKLKLNYRKVTPFLNISCICLVLFPIANFTVEKAPSLIENHKKIKDSLLPNLQDQNKKYLRKPNIYYIIFDAYTGSKELKSLLNFDNTEFEDYLQRRGFYIARNSYSNYSWTRSSIASSLNMAYLEMQPDKDNPNHFHFKDDLNMFSMISDNKVISYLKHNGYDYVDLSIWAHLADKATDHSLYQKHLFFNANSKDFYTGLVKMSFLSKPIGENYLEAKIKRETILEKVKALESVSNIKKPTFIYAHFLIPHHSYVFDQNGRKPNILSQMLQVNEKKLYLDQLSFTNKMAKEIIEEILSKSENPPIIIIQGDHGAWELGKNVNDNIKMRMSILNAYYLPGDGAKRLYESISPVNTFRVIFSHYFKQDLPLLPDLSYYNNGLHDSPWESVKQ